MIQCNRGHPALICDGQPPALTNAPVSRKQSCRNERTFDSLQPAETPTASPATKRHTSSRHSIVDHLQPSSISLDQLHQLDTFIERPGGAVGSPERQSSRSVGVRNTVDGSSGSARHVIPVGGCVQASPNSSAKSRARSSAANAFLVRAIGASRTPATRQASTLAPATTTCSSGVVRRRPGKISFGPSPVAHDRASGHPAAVVVCRSGVDQTECLLDLPGALERRLGSMTGQLPARRIMPTKLSGQIFDHDVRHIRRISAKRTRSAQRGELQRKPQTLVIPAPLRDENPNYVVSKAHQIEVRPDPRPRRMYLSSSARRGWRSISTSARSKPSTGSRSPSPA